MRRDAARSKAPGPAARRAQAGGAAPQRARSERSVISSAITGITAVTLATGFLALVGALIAAAVAAAF